MNRAQITKWLLEIRASYWFLPAVMVLGAIILSVCTISIDGHVESDWPEKTPFLFSTQPEGARSLLATVAGSMITVAGVTFSLTLLAVSHASSQFGPRILNNFMRDRANQFTLGTFISTFIFCLLVLRTVRNAEESTGLENAQIAEAFVPHISITVALILTLCSVGVLIFFIHHIPESIRLSNVVSRVGLDLQKSVDELFPEMLAHDQPEDNSNSPLDSVPSEFFEQAMVITLDHSGYVQTIDDQGILHVANENDLIVFLNCKPGDFYCPGTELLYAWPAERINDDVKTNLKSCYALGIHRTVSQNALFAVDQLVEVAQRALSPGINDPITANYCIDWLESALASMTQRKTSQVFRFNQNGELRLFTRPVGFEHFCVRVFDQLRQYVATDFNAAMHVIQTINSLRAVARSSKQLSVLDQHSDQLILSAENSGLTVTDIGTLKRMNKEGLQKLDSPKPSLKQLFPDYKSNSETRQ